MKGHSKKFTNKDIFAIVALCIAASFILLAFLGRYFSGAFRAFCNFFVGTFGMAFFGFCAATIAYCILYLRGKRIVLKRKYAINFALTYVVLVVIVHFFSTLGTVYKFSESYSQYVAFCYDYYTMPTFGGVVFGSISYALQSVLTSVGAGILLALLLALNVYFIVNFLYDYATQNSKVFANSGKRRPEPLSNDGDLAPGSETLKSGLENPLPQNSAMEILFSADPTTYEDHAESQTETFESAPQSDLFDDPVTSDSASNILFGFDPARSESAGSKFFADKEEENDDDYLVSNDDGFGLFVPDEQKDDQPPEKPADDFSAVDIFSESVSQSENTDEKMDIRDVFTAEQLFEPLEEEDEPEETPIAEQDDVDRQEVVEPIQPSVQNDIDQKSPPQFDEEQEAGPDETETTSTYVQNQPSNDEIHTESDDQLPENEVFTVRQTETLVNGGVQMGFDVVETEKLNEETKKIHHYAEYVPPMMDLLPEAQPNPEDDPELKVRASEAIVSKLAVFGIQAEACDPIVGPTVTQYRFKILSEKTRMSAFANMTDDLKGCLEAQDDIRIEAPIPGSNLVGIEVANKNRATVALRSVLESDEFKHAKGKLVFAIGQALNGKMIVSDLAGMPHLLVAGTTGSGKSVCLNCMIVSMMYKYSPEYLRFIMVDPKFVELSRYNGSPHLLTKEAITNVADALGGMDFLINEMEARYQLFRDKHVSNISEYNAAIDPTVTQRMPYYVLVVDELADLMSTSKKAVEAKIMRLAQKARAAGIHLVLATQRPSVDVITGTIKSNLSCRMALKVSSQFDSRTIIDVSGAEKLLGRGDMLLKTSDSANMPRIQSAYVDNSDIREIIQYCISKNEGFFEEDVEKKIFVSKQPEEQAAPEVEIEQPDKSTVLDPYCKKALRFWLEKNNGKASIASIQRALSVGFNRAGKIFEQLTTLGYVEDVPANESNSKPRKVLVTLEQLDELFPDMEG